jgi:hypothetical protein
MATTSVVYQVSARNYYNWAKADRDAVEAFLRAHDIEPRIVGVTDGSIVVRRLPDGTLELDLWVHDLEDGLRVSCPTCPSCVKQKRIRQPLKVSPPNVTGAYIAEELALA